MKRAATVLTTTMIGILLGCASSPAPVAPVAPPPSANRISTIQGRAHTSPLLDKRVEGIEGVVTAVLSGGRAPGFWMQDPVGDGDTGTSEGIFVSTRGIEVTVAPGDAVSVSGTVAESGREGSLTTTQIVSPEVTVVSQENPLPDPALVGSKGFLIPREIAAHEMKHFDPGKNAIDFWEALEGMRVEIHDPLVVGPSSRYGDMVVLIEGGIGAKTRSTHGGVVLQDNSYNSRRIMLDARLAGPFPTVDVGDRFVAELTGVVDYAFNNFRLVVTDSLPEPTVKSEPVEVTRLVGDDEQLTVATYNVLNLSAANEEKRFVDVAKTIVENLRSPDIIAVQEIQDDSGPEDDGVVTAEATFLKLAEGIVDAGGPRYDFRQIDPGNNQDGGAPGGNIRVGLLFNPERIEFVDRGDAGADDATAIEGDESVRLSLSPGRVDPANPCFEGGGEGELAEPTRKSLAAELRFREKPLFIVVNHWKSKRGDDALFGATQPPKWHTEEQRICQAEVIAAFAAKILEKDADARVIVLGDLNEHEFRPPVVTLEEKSGLTNLIERVVVADRYTYVYEGNSQVLDHILVSPSLLSGARIDIVHVNADRAAGRAASDHDPVLARLKM